MIEIYLKNNTAYDQNGDMTLTPTICTYIDSEKVVTIEHPYDSLKRYEYIKIENVLSISNNGKKQLYRIYNVIRDLDKILAYARPIFYDLVDTILLDTRPTTKTGQETLDIILKGTGFAGHSNINTTNTAYYIRKNIVESLIGDIDNSFLKLWGGEYLLDNFDIYINDKIGNDNGVRAEFGNNLESIEEDVNIDDVVTRIIPEGYDGIMLDGNTPWIDSPLILKYIHPKMRVIKFDDIKVKEKTDDEEGFATIEEARAEMITRCNKLFENGIDKPTVNYKISIVDLYNTTAYKDYKQLVELNKGDTVTCYIKDLDINVKARMIDFKRDEITGKYNSIELGNAKSNFFNNQADIQNKIDNILNSDGTVNPDRLNGAINALNTKFKALRDIAQPQQIRAMIFEDRIQDSPTFGCMVLGTMGFEIADSYKPGTAEWDFRTFGTGKGFLADCIVAGTLRAIVLESMDGSCKINLQDGIVNIAKGIIAGQNLSINLDEGKIKSTGVIAGQNYELEINSGEINSNEFLGINSKKGITIMTNNGNRVNYIGIADWGCILAGQAININSTDGVNIVVGNGNAVEINGRLLVNGREI